jgi:hypothetical protein
VRRLLEDPRTRSEEYPSLSRCIPATIIDVKMTADRGDSAVSDEIGANCVSPRSIWARSVPPQCPGPQSGESVVLEGRPVVATAAANTYRDAVRLRTQSSIAKLSNWHLYATFATMLAAVWSNGQRRLSPRLSPVLRTRQLDGRRGAEPRRKPTCGLLLYCRPDEGGIEIRSAITWQSLIGRCWSGR